MTERLRVRDFRARGVVEVVIGAIYLAAGILFFFALLPDADVIFFVPVALVGAIAIIDGIGTVRAADPRASWWRWPHLWLMLAAALVAFAGSIAVFIVDLPDHAGVGFALAMILWVLGAVPLIIGLRTARDLRGAREDAGGHAPSPH